MESSFTHTQPRGSSSRSITLTPYFFLQHSFIELTVFRTAELSGPGFISPNPGQPRYGTVPPSPRHEGMFLIVLSIYSLKSVSQISKATTTLFFISMALTLATSIMTSSWPGPVQLPHRTVPSRTQMLPTIIIRLFCPPLSVSIRRALPSPPWRTTLALATRALLFCPNPMALLSSPPLSARSRRPQHMILAPAG